MNAIEFEAQMRDGVLKIPKTYQHWNDKHVRVILIEQPETLDQPRETLLSRLKRIEIDGPPDFAEHIDDYLTGGKDAP